MTVSPGSDLPVLIVAFGAAELLEKCLQSVDRFHPGQDVLIWDNSGPDAPEVRELATRYPRYHWHFSAKNIGFAAAVNELAAMVPDRNFLLLNPDAELIGPLTNTVALLSEPDVAAVGPMRALDGFETAPRHRVAVLHRRTTPWDDALRKITLLRALAGPTGLGRLRGTPFSYYYRRAPEVVDGYISGSCLAVGRQAWMAVGTFDEEFFLYGEEREWQERAIDAGWKIRLADEVAVRHVRRGTVSHDVLRRQRSEDLLLANMVLLFEYKYGRRAAEFYLGWLLLWEAVRRTVRPAPHPRSDQPDVLVTVDGSIDEVRARIATAIGLDQAGHRVVAVSLQRLGILARDLPPSIRLVRRPWWWPMIRPHKLPPTVIAGDTSRQRALARLVRLHPGSTVSVERGRAAPDSGSR